MGVGVLTHEQPILPVGDPHCGIEVTALEFAVENEVLSPVFLLLVLGTGSTVLDICVHKLIPLMVLK